MTVVFLALLPVAIIILAGFLMRRTGFVSEEQWAGVDHVCYFVLFPAIIFKEIATADFTGVPVWRMAGAIIIALCIMFTALLILRKPLCRALGLNGAQFSSLYQGATRWHTFIAFAIVPLIFGGNALALAAVSAAAMTPILNVVNVAVISLYARDERPSVARLALIVLRNPFFLASVGGVIWQLLGIPLPPLAVQVLDMVGRGSLGLALLTVGAGLRAGEAMNAKGVVALAIVLKLLVVPLLIFVCLEALNVTGTPAAVAILCGAVPTGAGAYVLAKQMGGDAPLVANILTAQVIVAAVTIPLVLAYLA